MFNLSIFDQRRRRHRSSQNPSRHSSRNSSEFSPRQNVARQSSSEYETARSGRSSTQYGSARQQSTQYDTGRSRQQSTEYGSARQQSTQYGTAESRQQSTQYGSARSGQQSTARPSLSTRNPATPSPARPHPLGLRESPLTSSYQPSSSIYPRSTTYSPDPSSSRYYPPSAMRYPAESSRGTRRSSSRDRGPSRGEPSRGEPSRGEPSSRGGSSLYDPPPTYRTLPSGGGLPPSPPPPSPPPPPSSSSSPSPSPSPSPPPSPPPPDGPQSDSSDSDESEDEPAPPYRSPPMQAPRPPTAFNILERAGAEARETLRRMSRTEARNIRSFFQTDERNFHYLDIVGHGANSVAVRVKLRSRWYSSHHSEIFVVKRAIVAGVQRKLRNENRILRMLRGAKHIIQLYRTFSSIRNPIDRARGRTVMMEWAPNGTLGNFIRRLARSRDHQSNRMLHMLFMCLVRMCIAMAYPPRQGRRARPRREAFPGSRAAQERKTQLIHYDMHTNNILFGDVERPGDNDHYVLPPLKLIDFEDAEVLSGQHRHNQAVQSNILSIGMIMRCIITGSTNMNAHAVPVRTNVSGLDVTITSFANFPSNLYPDIDDALKSLVVQCCAVNPQERPSLEHLYERAHSHLHNRQYDFYRDTPSAPYERTPWIRRLVQEYILDADN